MPLLNKKRFIKNTIPEGLKDTDKVFYCDVTNEIFANYQNFAERIILCNSLVWACEKTGKSGLTYLEAMECEKNAKKLLKDFPTELRKPILYLITLTNRSSLTDLTEDIFAYVRERYFVGETLEYNSFGDQWISCRVLQVTMLTPKELADLKNGIKSNEKQFWPPGSAYLYEIELLTDGEGNPKAVIHVNGVRLRRKKSTYTKDRNHLFIKHFVCKVDGMWRVKANAYKRYDIGKVRFDEIFAGNTPKFPRSDSPKKTLKKSSTSVTSITLGTSKSPYKNGAVTSKTKKQESIDKYLKPKDGDKEQYHKSPSKRSSLTVGDGGRASLINVSSSSSDGKKVFSVSGKEVKSKQLNSNSGGSKKSAEKRKNTEEILEREMLEKRKKMMEHQQQLFEKKQQKQLDIQRKRDEKKKLEEFYKEWNKTREDLELEDLREFPKATVISLDSANEYFGQIVMLYEFFRTFSEQLNAKSFFPAGVTIELLDRAVSHHELAGPLCDIVHLLLNAIFRLQEEEENEIGEPYDSYSVAAFDSSDASFAAGISGSTSLTYNNGTNETSRTNNASFSNGGSTGGSSEMDIANVAINWPLAFFGVPLPKLTIDATTISEVLRLHLLSSGSRVSETCSRWRAQEKGGFISSDDPAVFFRKQNPHIIRTLSEQNIAALSVDDKLAVLECLANQIAMYSGVRSIIHENVETFRQRRVELRLALAAEIRKEKEIVQKKKEKKFEKGGGALMGSGGDDSVAKNLASKSDKSEENIVSSNSCGPVNIEMLDKLEKEVLRKKEDLRKQLADLTAENMKVQLAPLGVDRAYRRFWLFPSIPGIFIEDNEQNPPPCLPRGTPTGNPALMKEKDTLSYVRKLFQKEYNKENLGIFSSVVGSPKKNNVACNNSGVNGSSGSNSIGISSGTSAGIVANSTTGGLGGTCSGSDITPKEEPNRVPFSCWGDNELCPVHCASIPRVKWSCYQTETDYENLIDALNTRGKRESKLRAMLIQHRDTILKSLSRPALQLSKVSDDKSRGEHAVVETRKSLRGNPTYDDTMFGHGSENKDVEQVLEALLRDTILDIEEKSNAGGLGCLRVFDRETWVNAIKNENYEQSCEVLTWSTLNNESTEDACKDQKTNVSSKDTKYSNLDKFKMLNSLIPVVNPKVKELACAILQLEQSIELHYLIPPLGAEKNKQAGKVSSTELLKRWESSLMSCTSFAQLFLHVLTLENSIAWNRSAQNAYCRICRRRGDAQNMLLCDSCNKGHHLYCLKPKLTKIPKGDWHCHHCRPPPKEPLQKKKHTVYLAESDEDQMDKRSPIAVEKMELCNKGKCNTCNEKGATIGCSKCAKRYHLGCLIPPLRKTPTINWFCHSCRCISAKKEENHHHTFVGESEEQSSYSEPSRSSRRRTSKAANEKIYRFVKKLQTPNFSEDDDDNDDDDDDNVEYDTNDRTIASGETTGPNTRRSGSSGMVNGHGCRRRGTRHSMESRYTNQLPLDNAMLQEMLDKIMHHEDAWPFLRPVSRYEAADYAEIVKKPMDFATIKHKLNMLQYHTNSQVISDSMLVFSNCFLYNKETSDVHKAGVRLMEYFKKLCVELNFEKELSDAENQSKRANFDEETDNVQEAVARNDKREVEDEEDEEEVDDDHVEENEEQNVDDVETGKRSQLIKTKNKKNVELDDIDDITDLEQETSNDDENDSDYEINDVTYDDEDNEDIEDDDCDEGEDEDDVYDEDDNNLEEDEGEDDDVIPDTKKNHSSANSPPRKKLKNK